MISHYLYRSEPGVTFYSSWSQTINLHFVFCKIFSSSLIIYGVQEERRDKLNGEKQNQGSNSLLSEGSFCLFFSLHILAHSCMVLLVNVANFCLLNLIYSGKALKEMKMEIPVLCQGDFFLDLEGEGKAVHQEVSSIP